MATISNYFEQAQLSMAAYALNLTPGISGAAYTDKLEAAGMSKAQAAEFANTYAVVDQYTDPFTYIYASGDGTDTILDTDHQGIIRYDGIQLNGGKQTGDNTYQSDDGQFIYTLLPGLGTPNLLSITGPGGTILIKDFTANDLGIALNPADALPTLTEWPAADPDPNTAPDWTGLRNGTPYNDYAGSPDQVDLNGDGSNDIGNINGTAGAEVIHGLAGNDYIDGRGGADTLYGGDGNDWIIGEWGNDVLFGDAGNDYLDGDSADIDPTQHGADVLSGGEGDDYLSGGAGDDFLYGGAGNDKLWGRQFGRRRHQRCPDRRGLGHHTYYWRERHVGPDGNDYLDEGAGDDQLWVGEGRII